MLRETQIDTLASFLVQGLIARESIKPISGVDELVACVVELMSANFETEAQIEDEAEKMAEEQKRASFNVDMNRLRQLIKQRLAEKKGFTL
ncbi:MAG: DUF507 family protein [Candidatus Binataceae bacterium]